MAVTFDKLMGKVLMHKHKSVDISDDAFLMLDQTVPQTTTGNFYFDGVVLGTDNSTIWTGLDGVFQLAATGGSNNHTLNFDLENDATCINVTSDVPCLDFGDIDITTTGTINVGGATVTNLTDSGLTITRIPFASTAGLLVDNANFIYTTATSALQNTGLVTFIAGAAATVPLTIQGAASQSANLTEWYNSTPALLAYVHPDGDAGFAHMGVGKGTGTVGNGTNPSALAVLLVSESFIHTSSVRIGMNGSARYAGAGTGTMSINGVNFVANWAGTQNSSGNAYGLVCTASTITTDVNLNTLRAAQFISQHNRTGTVALQIGGLFQVDNQSTGTVTTQYGGQFKRSNAGTTTDSYGLYVEDLSGTPVSLTNNYGIYIAAQTKGTSDIGLYIADADTYSLQLASTDGDAASGITWATDTNLYRSAANMLKTDDGLTVVGAFGCNGATAQTAYASGGAVTTSAGAYGFASDAERASLTTLVSNIRAALVANGIMS